MAMLTPKQAGAALNISPDMMRDMLRDRELPAYKFGRQWRIEEKDLDAYKKRCRIPPRPGRRIQPGPSPLALRILDHNMVGQHLAADVTTPS